MMHHFARCYQEKIASLWIINNSSRQNLKMELVLIIQNENVSEKINSKDCMRCNENSTCNDYSSDINRNISENNFLTSLISTPLQTINVMFSLSDYV